MWSTIQQNLMQELKTFCVLRAAIFTAHCQKHSTLGICHALGPNFPYPMHQAEGVSLEELQAAIFIAPTILQYVSPRAG